MIFRPFLNISFRGVSTICTAQGLVSSLGCTFGSGESSRSQGAKPRDNGLEPGEPHQHLHRAIIPGMGSFPPQRRAGKHFARLYHSKPSNPAAGANLACPDPSRRHEPANLLRREQLPALPALAALPRWRGNGLSPGGTRHTKEAPCFLQGVRGPCQGTRVPSNSPVGATRL